jgi:hypothetical protein
VAGLPEHIRKLAELSPAEDLLLALLREGLPGIAVKTLIASDQSFPLVLVRRNPSFGNWGADTRFTDSARISVQAFCQDPDGDEDSAVLSEAVRVVLRDAWLTGKVVPDRGHLTHVEMVSAPRRATDWATATGPVQYADLPTGVWRYETEYQIDIRKPRSLPHPA